MPVFPWLVFVLFLVLSPVFLVFTGFDLKSFVAFVFQLGQLDGEILWSIPENSYLFFENKATKVEFF